MLTTILKIAGVAVLLMACGSTETTTSAVTPKATSIGELERWFPLEEGKIYQYITRDGDDTGMLVAKVHRTDSTHGELRLSNATKRFSITTDGISYVGGAYILKAPIEVGVSWEGEHGGSARIAATNVSVEVAAGHYAGCLRTVEEGGMKQPSARYEQTYCPGVGMVLLVVSAPGEGARAELKSYGLPVKIE